MSLTYKKVWKVWTRVKITDQQDQVNPIDDSFEKDKDKHQVQTSSSQDQDKTEYLELLQNIEIERDTTKI